MSSREQYKAALTRVKQELRQTKKFICEQNTDIAQLSKKLDDAHSVINSLSHHIHVIKVARWWKIRTIIKAILKLRQS